MTSLLDMQVELAHHRAGFAFTPHQVHAIEMIQSQEPDKGDRRRGCLFHRTGAGKSVTSLAMVKVSGFDQALVIAPPITHDSWLPLADEFGMTIQVISHAKFRMPNFKVSRTVPIICDEFHMLGGVHGKGWKKFDRIAAGVNAPIIACSATPNYNDAERVYCIQHALDPFNTKGGFLDFVYKHCTTEPNHFGATPIVTGFRNYADAAEYLSALPYVAYLPDDTVLEIQNIVLNLRKYLPPELLGMGLNHRTRRITASAMEERHQVKYHKLLDSMGLLRLDVYEVLSELVGNATTPVLLYCSSSQVARGLADLCEAHNVSYGLITGAVSTTQKALIKQSFIDGELDVLIGTSSLATGMDGVDKMCDTLIIVDDTDDDALRRQLMGRILPRGLDTDTTGKSVYRLVF